MTTHPTSNIEIKARCSDLERVRGIALALPGVEALDRETQIDTYFHTRSGRLKLRQSSVRGAELIPYQRTDEAKARLSLYQRLPVEDAEATRSLMSDLLGVLCEVKKERDVLLWRGVRIHLDQVEGLGEFLELEAVCNDQLTPEEGKRLVEDLLGRFGIESDHYESQSYENLIRHLSTADGLKSGLATQERS